MTQGTAIQGRMKMRRKMHRFQTDAAVILSVCTVVLLGAVTLYSRIEGLDRRDSPDHAAATDYSDDRRREVVRALEGASAAADGTDYSTYACDGIFSHTSLSDAADRCSYAQTCNGGEGMYLPIVFCRTSVLSTAGWLAALSPFLAMWLVLLFRMLGTTAEDYFSPSLEMFSLKMGLPPRFAGVTLLALGNGAADVSATINAITSDPANGYQMSLGALTGAGMFVGTVVAGVVIVIADGVRCRGALVRDVIMLVITLVVVFVELRSGVVGPRAESTFLSMYVAFVVVVLIADVYHRAVVLPRLQKRIEMRERERQEEEGRRVTAAAGAALNDLAEEEEQVQGQEGQGVGAALSTQTTDSGQEPSTEMSLQFAPTQQSIRIMTDGREEAEFTEEVPVRNKALNAVLMALSNYDRAESSMPPEGTMDEGMGVVSDLDDRPVVLHGPDGILNRHHGGSPPHRADQYGEGIDDVDGGPDGYCDSPYTAMVDSVDMLDRICTEDGHRGFSASNWTGAWHDGTQELKGHALDCWDEMFRSEENNALDKFLLACELPFTFFRKITVPIPCEGYYCRALVALSIAMSPLWLGVYFLSGFDINLFSTAGFPAIVILLLFSSAIASLVMRFAPGGDGMMALGIAFPIAFYGFFVAATWIDAIADQLVKLLGFLGIVCRIPSSIMGLTILAWGNSMGDLSANMTMAKKGLANMAITACFAGPVFNILVGLGAGFSFLSNVTGEAENEVSISPSVGTGFLFMFFNCLLVIVSGICWNKGTIPKSYGYAALALYTLYIIASVGLQFAKHDD